MNQVASQHRHCAGEQRADGDDNENNLWKRNAHILFPN
jgi:hypothetical protein